MRDIGHFINGRRVAGSSGRHGDVFDPNSGQAQARLATYGERQVAGLSPELIEKYFKLDKPYDVKDAYTNALLDQSIKMPEVKAR